MRARKITVWIFSGIVVTSILFSFYFFLRKPEKIGPPKLAEEEKKMIVIKDATYTSEKGGKIDIRLKAKLAKKYLDKNEIEMEGIEGAYVSEKKGQLSFKGEKGMVDTEKQTGILYGFKAHIFDEYEVTTESIRFDLRSGSAFGEEPVFIKGEKLSMKGTGIKGELKEGKFTLLRDVSGSIHINGENYSFKSNTFSYESAKARYLLEGNVKADKPDMRVTCNTMYIYGGEKGIKRIEALGATEMFSKGTVAKSEKAVYDFNQKKVVFTGGAHIIREDMELKGDVIEYDVDKGSFSTTRPKMKIIKKGS